METVLIISKPRFGSTTLSKVLGELKQCHVFDEPNVLHLPYVKKWFTQKRDCVIKVVVGDEEVENRFKEFILSYPFNTIILLSRNEDDAKTSMSYAMEEPESFEWHQPYRQNKTEFAPNVNLDAIDKFYNHGEHIYHYIRSKYKDKVIEIEYDRLYHKDVNEREKQLSKLHDLDKTHWLLKKNALDRLDPKNKYTNLPLLEKGIL